MRSPLISVQWRGIITVDDAVVELAALDLSFQSPLQPAHLVC